jgi:flagellar hook-associated protein 2
MPLTATGIGSGLDVEALVAQLVLSDIAPNEQRINRTEASYQAEISAFGSIKSALASFQSAAASAANASQFKGNSATTSLFSAVTATASDGAAVGNYALEVSTLASGQSLASTTFASTSDIVGTGTLSIAVGASAYNVVSDVVDSFSPKAGVDSVAVVIDSSNNTLAGVRDAINSANAGVAASIINDGSGYRLVLTSIETGTENSVNISVVDTGDANDTDAVGLSRFAFNTSVANLDQTKAASDANLKINGLSVTSATNSVSTAVEGVTFSLKSTTESPVSISVVRDTSKAKAALEGFVDEFNSLTKALNSYTLYDPDIGKGSLLTGDATLRTLSGTVRNYLNDSVPNGGIYSTLADLGITTKVLDGTLQIDSTRLQKVLDEDPTDLARVLAGFGTPSNPNVRFVSGSLATVEGIYSVSVSETPVSAGNWVAGAALGAGAADADPSFNGNGNDAQFTVSIDALGTQSINIGENYQITNNGTFDQDESAALATAIQQKIDDAFGVTPGDPSITTVTFEAGVLKITSATSGSASSVSVTPTTGFETGNTLLGINSGTSTAGTSTLGYFINGEAASESDGILTGAVGTDVEGLQLEILGNAVGNLGTISFSRGIAVQVNSLITDLLASDGLIEARLEGLNSSIKDLESQRDALELRANALEKRYRNQFNGLETLISQLNTTQTFLSQALSGFVEPNTTLRK